MSLHYTCGRPECFARKFFFLALFRTLATTTATPQELGLKRATGHRKGEVEGIVLVSDGLDSPSVSNWEVSM